MSFTLEAEVSFRLSQVVETTHQGHATELARAASIEVMRVRVRVRTMKMRTMIQCNGDDDGDDSDDASDDDGDDAAVLAEIRRNLVPGW